MSEDTKGQSWYGLSQRPRGSLRVSAMSRKCDDDGEVDEFEPVSDEEVRFDERIEFMAVQYGIDIDFVFESVLLLASELTTRSGDADADCEGLRYAATILSAVAGRLGWDAALAAVRAGQAKELEEKLWISRYLAGAGLSFGVPLWDRSELAVSLHEVCELCRRDQSHLIETGRPLQFLSRHSWLWAKCAQSYPVRRIRTPAPQACVTESGDLLYDYVCSDAPNAVHDGFPLLSSCLAEEADAIEGLEGEDVDRLNAIRPQYVDMKLRILETAQKYLQARPSDKLLNQCLPILAAHVSGDEAAFLLAVDDKLAALENKRRSTSRSLCAALGHVSEPIGGLHDFIELIGHVQKECDIGTFHNTRSLLGDLVVGGEKESDAAGRHLAGQHYWPYIDYLGTPGLTEVDRAIQEFIARDEEEPTYWREFQDAVRVGISQELVYERLIRLKSVGKHVDALTVHVNRFADWASNQLRVGHEIDSWAKDTTTPCADVNSPTNKPVPALTVKRRTELLSIKEKIAPEETYIGECPAILDVFERIGLYNVDSNKPVLIRGDRGTGKSKIAELIWKSSARAKCPYTRANAVSYRGGDPRIDMITWLGAASGLGVENIHKNGQAGLVENFEGGTIFVDEIGSASMEFQTMLLDVTQGDKVKRIGEKSSKKAGYQPNVRLILATNMDLEQRVSVGLLRQDFLDRISGRTLWLPKLSARGLDIICLANFFVKVRVKGKHTISDELYLHLLADDWEGNVRPLKERLDLAVDFLKKGSRKLTLDAYMQANKLNLPTICAADSKLELLNAVIDHLREEGREEIRQIDLAAIFQVNKSTVKRWLDKYGLKLS